jgi:hypothetical protein
MGISITRQPSKGESKKTLPSPAIPDEQGHYQR